MKKQMLEKIRSLKATSKMMQMAAADPPRREKYTYANQYYYEMTVYNHGLYMRCHIQNDILLVAFFLPEHMRSGGRNPAYELFIERESKQFITYDRLHDRWRTAKLDLIEWPSYVRDSKQKWINPFEYNMIKNYLGGEHGGYEGLAAYQRQVRADELKKRHKKETDPWDKDLEQVPKLPRDWKHWVDKVGIRQKYIYYQYSKKGADTGYCTYCEKDVSIKQPRHNKEGRCPRCRHKITFKAIGKAGTVVTDRFTMYLIQRCTDGFVIRQFTGRLKYPKSEYKNPVYLVSEIRRAIYDKNAQAQRAYYMGVYKQSETRWILNGLCSPSWWGYDGGKVYGKTLPSLIKKELSRTGLAEALSSFGTIDPEKYLAVLQVVPQLEKLAKAKLSRMVYDCLSSSNNFHNTMHDANAKSLTKMLGINKQELKRLRQNDGGFRFASWLKYENVIGKLIPDNIIAWFCAEKIETADIKFMRGRMSAVQIYNYLRRQMSANNEKSRTVLTTWADYLSMAKRLKMDTDDAIVYRVNKLFQRHDELVELCHEKALAIRAGEIMEKYPHADEICKPLQEKYGYANESYTVIAPSNIEDILLEARALHHCADDDRYFERIERRETYVLFLRKTSEADKPYYTLEVEPNATVRQKRTMYDRQEADIEDAKKFLLEWQEVVSERLEAEDLKLAEESRSLRIIEYAQLRDNRAIIRTGDLAGELLVDVLLADLMENTVQVESAETTNIKQAA